MELWVVRQTRQENSEGGPKPVQEVHQQWWQGTTIVCAATQGNIQTPEKCVVVLLETKGATRRKWIHSWPKWSMNSNQMDKRGTTNRDMACWQPKSVTQEHKMCIRLNQVVELPLWGAEGAMWKSAQLPWYHLRLQNARGGAGIDGGLH